MAKLLPLKACWKRRCVSANLFALLEFFIKDYLFTNPLARYMHDMIYDHCLRVFFQSVLIACSLVCYAILHAHLSIIRVHVLLLFSICTVSLYMSQLSDLVSPFKYLLACTKLLPSSDSPVCNISHGLPSLIFCSSYFFSVQVGTSVPWGGGGAGGGGARVIYFNILFLTGFLFSTTTSELNVLLPHSRLR